MQPLKLISAQSAGQTDCNKTTKNSNPQNTSCIKETIGFSLSLQCISNLLQLAQFLHYCLQKVRVPDLKVNEHQIKPKITFS